MAAPSFVAGDSPSANQVDNWMINTTYAFKSADTSLTNQGSVLSDPHLSVNVDANTTYRFELFMKTTSSDGTLGVAWRLLCPLSTSLYGYGLGQDMQSAGFSQGWTIVTTTGAIASQQIGTLLDMQNIDGSGATVTHKARYGPVLGNGIIQTAGTSGTVTLQWCQSPTSATAVTVQRGSYLFLRRLA